ncbi:MAG: hypothetical protein JJ992_11220 [Planctomycetes bacterium]|nr:hypothetical protein [Planctomycetota bacterium]
MNRHRLQIVLLVLTVSLVSLVDDAGAWPRRRTRSYGNYSGGSVRVASKADSESSDYRTLRAYYSYELACGDNVAFEDRIRVFLRVLDDEVSRIAEPLVAEVKIMDLSDYESTRVKYVPVKLREQLQGEEKLAVFDVTNAGDESPIIKPGKVYRLFVNLHRKSNAYGAESVLGRVPTPYYVATSGDTRLQQARQYVAMRTFKEFYYTERGWRSEEQYPMDCHAFYCWATGSCTVGAQYGRANLGRLFGGRTPYRSGGNIAEIAEKESIHGDYVRIPGHTFMLLAYDAKLGQVWTMEGNFNRTIEVAIRSTGSGWSVGHLAEEHIRDDMFDVATESSDSGTSTASLERRGPGSS